MSTTNAGSKYDQLTKNLKSITE